jgi:hypothetical protein
MAYEINRSEDESNSNGSAENGESVVNDKPPKVFDITAPAHSPAVPEPTEFGRLTSEELQGVDSGMVLGELTIMRQSREMNVSPDVMKEITLLLFKEVYGKREGAQLIEVSDYDLVGSDLAEVPPELQMQLERIARG